MTNCGPLLELEDVRGRLGLYAQSAAGLRAIPIDAVIGTVDRCCDFDRCFHPLRPELRNQVAAIERVFEAGAFPPIEVIQVDKAFFVADGHKRIAAARALGVAMIDAQVTQLVSPLPLDSTTDARAVDRLEAEDRLLRETGLRRARPQTRIECLAVASYAELEEIIKAHGYDLMRSQARLVGVEEVAAHWHDCDFRPTLQAARAAGIDELLACCPPGDVYLVLHRRAGARSGLDCDALQGSVNEAAAELARARRPRARLRSPLRRRRTG